MRSRPFLQTFRHSGETSELHDSGSPPRLTYADSKDPFWRRSLISAIELSTGRRELQRRYDRLVERWDAAEPAAHELWAQTLDALDIDLRVEGVASQDWPQDGPLVVVANHPFGVVDGLAVAATVARVRREFGILVHDALLRDPRLSPFLLPVDFREGREARRTTARSCRSAVQRLRAGEALVVFPAGGVATAAGWGGPVIDLDWKSFVYKAVRRTGAPVVPLYVHGSNSGLFQTVSQFGLDVRLALMLREVRNKIGSEVRITGGNVLQPDDWNGAHSAGCGMADLRQRTMALGGPNADAPDALSRLPRHLRD